MSPAEKERQAAAFRVVFREHDALSRERDDVGAPFHDCGPLGGVCPFILDRGHALGIKFAHCACPACAS